MFVIGFLGRAGSERQMVYLAAGLVRRGHNVAIALLQAPGPLEAEAVAAGVELFRLYETQRRAVGRIFHLVQLIRQWKPDVVHPYLPRENGLTALIKPWMKGAKLIWGIRASDMDWSKYSWRTRRMWPLVVRAARRADLIIANSQAGASHHITSGYPSQTVIVIPNGVNTERFQPDHEQGRRLRESLNIGLEAPVIAMLARFDPMKGHDELLAVLALLVHQHPHLTAVIAGGHTAEQAQRFLAHAESLGVRDHLKLLGETDDARGVLNATDVLAVPSLSEGFPNVVLEALACGTPCVTYAVGDLEHIPSRLLKVVPVGDRAAFAEALSEILHHRADAERLPCEVVTQNYSVEQMVTATERAILHCANPTSEHRRSWWGRQQE
jgi:glycosyltransferase involved in cell wall biosynthesis